MRIPPYHGFSFSPWLLLVCYGCQLRPEISFRNNVYPVLEANCVACHTSPAGEGYRVSGLNMESYQTLMAGTDYGPVIIPGSSKGSILNMLVEGRADASMRMPHNRDKPLSDDEIAVLRLWVNQGAQDN
jgi:hypothetical protein